MAILEGITIEALITGLKDISSYLAGYVADRTLDKVLNADEKSLSGYKRIVRQLYDALDEAYKAACDEYKPPNINVEEQRLEYDGNAVYDYLSNFDDMLSAVNNEEDVTEILRFFVGEKDLAEQGMDVELVTEDMKQFFMKRLLAAVSARSGLNDYIKNVQEGGLQERKSTNEIRLSAVSRASTFDVAHEFDFFGREADIENIQRLLQANKVTVVCGEGGIGKTEVCREVISRWAGPCFSVNMIGCADYYEMLLRVSSVLGLALNMRVMDDRQEHIIAYLEECIIKKLEAKKAENILLYFDNYEDIMGVEAYESEEDAFGTHADEGRKANGFVVNDLRRCGARILISSKNKLISGNTNNYPIDTLECESAVQLFCHIWGMDGMEHDDEYEKITQFVKNDLENYPLSIVIAASQKDMVNSVDELIVQWSIVREEMQNEGAANPRQLSLKTAVRFSWNQISSHHASRFAWELFLLFPGMVDKNELTELLSGRLGEGEARAALRHLKKASIIRTDRSDRSYRMYGPLKSISGFEHVSEELKDAASALADYYCQKGEEGKINDEVDIFIKDIIEDILYLIEYCRKTDDYRNIVRLHDVFFNYYGFASVRAYEVIREIDADRLDTPDKANVLQSQGDLAMRVDDLEGAERKYGEAEKLYRKVHDMIGLAYTISELCFLSAKKDDMDKVIDYATQAKEMIDLIPYESVKKYVAQKAVQAVELLGNDK